MSQRGDTIVEVIIAFAVFSLISITAIAIMNQGLATAQNSLEVSLVRQQLDSQADTLRFVRDSDIPSHQTVWQNISSAAAAISPVTTEELMNNGCPASMPAGGFALAVGSGGNIERVSQFQAASMYSGVVRNPSGVGSTAYGLWVQPARAEGTAGAYDMHIRACWYSAGDDRPTVLSTIVRLYET